MFERLFVGTLIQCLLSSHLQSVDCFHNCKLLGDPLEIGWQNGAVLLNVLMLDCWISYQVIDRAWFVSMNTTFWETQWKSNGKTGGRGGHSYIYQNACLLDLIFSVCFQVIDRVQIVSINTSLLDDLMEITVDKMWGR